MRSRRPFTASDCLGGNLKMANARWFAIAAVKILRDPVVMKTSFRPKERPTWRIVAGILKGCEVLTRRGKDGLDVHPTDEAVRTWVKKSPSAGDVEGAEHMEAEMRALIAAQPDSPPLSIVEAYAKNLGAL